MLPVVENPTIRALQRGVNQMASADLVVRPAPVPDSLQSNTAKGSATTGCILGCGVQAYGSNLRVGTLGCSERALGYSEPPKLLTPEGAAARLRGVGITRSTWVRRVLRPSPVNRLCTPHSGFAYTIRFINVADQFQVFCRTCD